MSKAQPAQLTARIEWVDTAKGIAIILVVFGHVIRGLVTARILGQSPAEQFADAWIYAFHMPLFFFLSGLFIPRSLRRPYSTYVEDKLRTIAYPYFVWSAITVVFKSTLSRFTNHPMSLRDGWRILFEPIEQFWFLYALFLLTVFFGGLLKLGLKPWMLLIVGLLLNQEIVPISLGDWGPVLSARRNALYVALGIWCGAGPQAARFSEMSPAPLWSFAVSAFGVLTAMVAWHLQRVPGFAILMAIVGSAGCLAASNALSQRPGLIDRLFRICGLISLEIFVTHTMASAGTRIALQKVAHIQNPTIHIILGTLAGLIFPIALGVACRRYGLNSLFTLRKSARPATVLAS